MTPTAIHESSWRGLEVIWVELSTRLPAWIVERWEEPPDWVKEIAELSEPISASEAPPYRLAVCWIPERWGLGSPDFVASMLVQDFMDTLHRRALIPQVEEWHRQETASWIKIGWRDWQIRVPTRMAPCPEVLAVARLHPVSGSMKTVTYADIKRDLKALRLHQAVPETVFELFNRAAKLYLYGYRDWEFFSIAEWPATVALETSLRTLYAAEQKYPAEVAARARGGEGTALAQQTVQGPGGLWYAAERLREQVGREPFDVLVNGSHLLDRKPELLAWAINKDWVAPIEKWRWESGFSTRDRLSHPQGVSLRWISHVYGEIAQAALLTNRLWMRYRHPDKAIWENAYTHKPTWKGNA